MPWLFLGVTLVGAWFTFNAYLPHRRSSPMVVPSFFAGWLTGELSAHHFAWQLGATVFFVATGALDAWPGWVGLGITLASWVGLGVLLLISARSNAEIPGAQHAFEMFHSLRTRHVVRGVDRFLTRILADYRAARASSRGGKRLRSASTISRAPASTLSVPVLTTRS